MLSFNPENHKCSIPLIEKWNDDSLVVDPWKRTVYTKQEFLLVNSPENFYGLNDRIRGKTEIEVQHNESLMSFLLFKGIKLPLIYLFSKI
jgi:hypothetical protein